jgi:hypothetical protein
VVVDAERWTVDDEATAQLRKSRKAAHQDTAF